MPADAESQGHHRAWLPLAAITLLAFAVRLLHVLTTAKLLVTDDAVFFEQHAVAFVDAWRAIGSPTFWDQLREAVDHASLQGIVYPIFLSLIYLPAGGVSHTAAAVGQAILGAATVWLTALAAYRAFGRTAGLAAGLLAAVHPPLVITAGLLLAEAVLAFLQALLFYLLLRALDPRSRWSAALAGLASGLLMLRPAFQYAGPLCLAGLLAAALLHRHPPRWLLRTAGRYLAGLLLVAAPWLAVNGFVYGAFKWSRTGDAWQQVYWGIYPPNRGWWPPDSPVPPKYGVESLPGARAAGRVIEVNDLDYLEAAIAQVRATPLQALATEVNKLYHAYLHPFNTYAERPLVLAWIARPLHRVLALLVLAGFAISWRRPAPSALLACATLAVSLPFLVSHIDLRYTIPIALAGTLFAGHAISALVRLAAATHALSQWRRPAAALALMFGAWGLGVPWLAALTSTSVGDTWLPPLTLHRLHTASVVLAWLGAAYLIGSWLADRAATPGSDDLDERHRPRAPWLASAIGTGALVVTLYGIQAFYDGDWHEWSAVIRPGERALQTISLPSGWMPPPGSRAEVRLYADGSRDHSYEPVISLMETQRDVEIAALGPAFTEGGPLRFEERIMVTASQQGKVRAEVPQWYGVPIALDSLRGSHVILGVSLRARPGQDASGAWIRLWGDYQPHPSQRYYEGPSIHSRIQGTDDSFQKFVATGHPRLWRRVPLASGTGGEIPLASRITRDGSTQDLSPSPGHQSGEYRLRILVFGPAGDLLVAF